MQGDFPENENVSRPLIAAVDDDFRLRESIESLLESAGYEPAIFSSAEEFLNSGILATAACVITDVRMPGIDGFELHRRISARRPEVPVIFISAHVNPESRPMALCQGAFEFLYKPFDAAELLKTVQSALSKSHSK